MGEGVSASTSFTHSGSCGPWLVWSARKSLQQVNNWSDATGGCSKTALLVSPTPALVPSVSPSPSQRPTPGP